MPASSISWHLDGEQKLDPAAGPPNPMGANIEFFGMIAGHCETVGPTRGCAHGTSPMLPGTGIQIPSLALSVRDLLAYRVLLYNMLFFHYNFFVCMLLV